MATRRIPESLYIANLALLATHQADAAFWREWEVFGLPVGPAFFLAFSLAAVMVLLLGLAAVVARHRSARAFAMACALVGVATCTIHAVFLVRDRVAFWTPMSLGILIGILLASAAQLGTVRELARVNPAS